MQFFRLKIGHRIIGLVLVLLLLMAGCFLFAILKMESIGKELQEVVEEDVPLTKVVTQITIHQLEQGLWLERALRYGKITPSQAEGQQMLKVAEEKVKKDVRLIKDEIKKAKLLTERAWRKAATEEQRQIFQGIDNKLKEIEKQYENYDGHVSQFFEELRLGNIHEAEVLAKEIEKEAEELISRLGRFEMETEGFLKDALTSAERHEQTALKGLTVINLIAFVFGLVAGTFVARGITTKLRELIARLKELAVGEADLTKQLAVTAINCSQEINCGKPDCPSYGKEAHCWYEAGSYAPVVHCPKIKSGTYQSCEECKVYQKAIPTEIDEVSTFVNAFILRIRDLIARAKNQGEEVASEAQNLSAVSEQLANGAVEAQSQAEEVSRVAESTGESVSSVAAAMEEMTATVNEIAEHTTRASQIAQEASEETAKAQEVINNLAQAASRISEMSKLIGSIADQTKLLALNATIEAARAGEAGKGFAVVANEVKELAQQTGNSVTDIDTMVRDLQQGVSHALEAMNRISEVIQQVVEFSSNVATAIEEQTATTNEVSANTQKVSGEVSELVRMSQAIAAAGDQTAQGAEQVRGTAHKLRGLSDDLMKLLREFKV